MSRGPVLFSAFILQVKAREVMRFIGPIGGRVHHSESLQLWKGAWSKKQIFMEGETQQKKCTLCVNKLWAVFLTNFPSVLDMISWCILMLGPSSTM